MNSVVLNRPHQWILLSTLVTTLLVGCSSLTKSEYPVENKAPVVDPNSPPAPPPPQKKKELVSVCKVMNGEGRTFIGKAGTMYGAQMKAKQQCETYYRHCTLLKCESVEE
jgi:hypothetical protein